MLPGAPKPPLKLPKLRNGVTIAFNDYDLDGKPQWLINDSARNKFFIIGLVEYELLNRWNLGDAVTLVNAVNNETTLQVDESDVENLLKFLAYNYLIQQSGYQIYKHAKDQKLFKSDNLLHWLISYYLFFKIPLLHPDNFLSKTKRIGEIIFSRTTFYVMCGLAALALFQINSRWDEFTHTFSSIFTYSGLFFAMIAYMITKLFHELGHAYMCKKYGVPVPALGLAFLVFWPVLYTDTTLSWSLKSNQRLRIALAGIQVETYVTIIAALIWCNVHNTVIQSVCYTAISINWLASVLINVSPFMRFDGYYVLADYLKMPNLQPRAFALARWQIRRWLFNWPDPPPENCSPKLHYLLVGYALITWIYRLFLYFGIALLVYHFFIKVIGIFLFAIELFYFILGPIVREIQAWVSQKEKFSYNRRTKITIFFAVLAALIFFIPIKETIRLPGTLSYTHEFLVAPEEAVITAPLPKVGTKVLAHQPIIKLRSPDINHALEQTILEYEKNLAELRRASIDPKYSSNKAILESNINKLQAKYAKLMEVYKKFTLSVSFDGIILDVAPHLEPGTVVKKDEWLADVIKPNTAQIEGYVFQIDVNIVKAGLTGYFYPDDITQPSIPVKVVSVEMLNASKLNCHFSEVLERNKNEPVFVDTPCYNASDLGGDVATYLTDEGEYVPVNSVFRVVLAPLKPVKLTHVQRGIIMVDTRPTSYAYSFFYNLKTSWIKQTGF